MLSRLFTTSFFVTLIAGIPAYFLAVQGLQSSTIALTQLLMLVFLVSAVSVWLGARSSAPRPKARKRAAPSVPSNAARESGSVKWFNASKGFGFITRDSGDDIFVHFRSIRGEGHRILRDGQRVEFAVSQGDKGLQADDVVPAR